VKKISKLVAWLREVVLPPLVGLFADNKANQTHKRGLYGALVVMALAFIVLVPRYWTHGYWEPHEIQVADKVSKRLDGKKTAAVAPRGGKAKKSGPPLTEWSIAKGVSVFDDTVFGATFGHEFGARFPLVLFGFMTVLGTFFLGLRLASARAGLISACVMLSFPMFLFQARHLNSNLGAAAGSTLLVLGLVGLFWPKRDLQRVWMYPVDVALVVLGAVMSYYGAALVLGLLAPVMAVAIASAISLRGRSSLSPVTGDVETEHGDKNRQWDMRHLISAVGIATVASVVLLGILFFAFFDIREGYPGERGLFGQTIATSLDYTNVIGGQWKDKANLGATFDVMFEQMAFGMFPWIALAPIVLARFAAAPAGTRRAWGGYIMFLWALFAWAVASVYLRKVGPVHFPALAAVAVGVGLWLDDLLTRRAAAAATNDDTKRDGLRLPLIALFVFFCVLVLAKDLQPFAEKILGVHILGAKLKWPVGTNIKFGLLVFGALFAVPLAISLWGWGYSTRPRTEEEAKFVGLRSVIDDLVRGFRAVAAPVAKWGVHASVVTGVVFGMFLTQCWTPTLSEKFSSKKLYQYYKDHKGGGDEIGLMGAQGSPPKYYLREKFTQLRGRPDLLKFLAKQNRVFAVTPRRELCPVHRAAKSGVKYHVLYDRHAQLLLMSNKVGSGESDLNPLPNVILRAEPEGIKSRFAKGINFNNQIELIGVTMPNTVRLGRSFTMSLYFKVLRKVSGNWKIFVHFDGPGIRFQGDHTPIRGLCTTGYWDVGDYIIDTFTVEAGQTGHPRRPYQVYMGFFQGRAGNWRNMKVIPKRVNGQVVKDKRVPIGVIRVK